MGQEIRRHKAYGHTTNHKTGSHPQPLPITRSQNGTHHLELGS
jgi:hypothetical protein